MYDIIVLGAGFAGMSAAIYAARASKKVLLIEKLAPGGQILKAHKVENYPGFKEISGSDLVNSLYDQVKALDIEYHNEEIIEVKHLDDKHIEVKSKTNTYEGKNLIIATGSRPKKLNLPEEDKYLGKGLSFCAYCDGFFFRNRKVAVSGGGNTAFNDARYLSTVASKTLLISRRDIYRAEQILVDEVKKDPKIELMPGYVIVALHGDKYLESLTLQKDDSTIDIEVDGLFLAIGEEPDTELFKGLLAMDEKGYLLSSDTRTIYPNIFVAGDCRTKEIRQLTTAASDGTMAGIFASRND